MENPFLCRRVLTKYFDVKPDDRISVRITSYPLKESYKIRLSVTNFDGCFDKLFWSIAGRRNANVYHEMQYWLDNVPEIYDLAAGESIIIYASVYIHEG